MPTLIGTDEPDRWRAALEGLAHGYWHRWEPNHALALATGAPVYLYSDHDERTGARAACPLAERRGGEATDVYSPAGFSGFVGSGDTKLLRARWLEMAARRRWVCGYFALHPREANAALHSGLAATRVLYLIDLAQGADAALARFDRDVHRVLRRWRDGGGELVHDRARLRDFVFEHYAPFMASVGAAPSTILPDAALRAMCDDPDLLMVGAADGHGVCSAYTFGVSPHGADSHLSLSVREGRRHIPVLVAWGIETLAPRGARWLNLGGGVVDGDAISRAKRKFNPEQVPLLTAREVYDEAAFARLCAQAGVATDGDGWFPPYRRPAQRATIAT